LNLYKPVIAHNFLESAELLSNAAATFGERFVAKLEANEEHCETRVEQSMALATALNPAIGYDKASKVAKTALKEGKSVREAAVDAGYLTEEEADEGSRPRSDDAPSHPRRRRLRDAERETARGDQRPRSAEHFCERE